MTLELFAGPFIVGFTGPRKGMSKVQKKMVSRAVEACIFRVKSVKGVIGLHGDCVGGDEEFDEICKRDHLLETVCMPCTFDNLRAYCTKAIAEPVAPMQRNRNIVEKAHAMVAAPPTREEIRRGSGTWATIKFTRRAEKTLYLCFPDGEVQIERVDSLEHLGVITKKRGT
jgi:hypothetical protein